jgi:hypothetical protein
VTKAISFAAIALALTVGGCCMGGSSAPAAPINIAGPGFTPDPTTATGLAGGVQQASVLAASDVNGNSCVGNIPLTAQHTVHVGAALPLLRVLVNGSQDSTLVVRGPTGTFYCNDDSGDPGNGLNPVVEIPNAAAGDYQVYVGAYSSDSTLSTYTIGFTATPGTFPSQVVH